LSDTLNAGLAPGHDIPATTYNDVPYTSSPDPARHPERLATIGTLLGLDVAPVATSRVLEFACGDGANLVPIASMLPHASFVGFDVAAAPIARARRMAGDLGLANLRLLELDLRALPEDLGQFDYIIAHGLYSWIPAEVREHVMPLIARHLAPKGVALVSYNTLPGCHMRRIVWDMLAWHTRNIAGKAAKVTAARALLDLVATPVSGDNASEQAMRGEVRNAAVSADASLAHDELSEANVPFHFHEFAADAQRAGLVYMAEARLGTMTATGLAAAVAQALGRLDRLAREQYLDFIRFRHFRESLLCHADALSQFAVQPARALGMHVLPSLELRRAGGDPARAAASDDTSATVTQCLLARWPRSVAVSELLQLQTRCAAASRPIEQVITELYVAGLVDLRTAPIAVAIGADERPAAFAAARWLSREHNVIPSLHHEALRFQDPLARKLLALLDGTRTRDELAAALGSPFAGPAGRARLDKALAVLAGKALLVG
jgi:SAM-dependent methyltransferase